MPGLTPQEPESGQTLTEPGAILGLVALVVVAALILLGGQVSAVVDAASTPV